jgi:hypothetical protein
MRISEDLRRRLTSSLQAFYVPGKLTVTVVWITNLVLVSDLHYTI